MTSSFAGNAASASGGSFEAALSGATAAQPASAVLGAQKPDPVDEEKALQELFHILALLSLGQIDYGSLAKCDSASGTPPGPRRMEVERLKELIRRILRGGEDEPEIDPKTGKPRTQGTGQSHSSGTSLNALFKSLPTEIQNLLRRAFPNLDQMLLDEQQKMTAAKTDAANAAPDRPEAQPDIEGTACFLARILDASNRAITARTAEARAGLRSDS